MSVRNILFDIPEGGGDGGGNDEAGGGKGAEALALNGDC
jgi:hypothetical protein